LPVVFVDLARTVDDGRVLEDLRHVGAAPVPFDLLGAFQAVLDAQLVAR
jgi:hypothetical protein